MRSRTVKPGSRELRRVSDPLAGIIWHMPDHRISSQTRGTASPGLGAHPQTRVFVSTYDGEGHGHNLESIIENRGWLIVGDYRLSRALRTRDMKQRLLRARRGLTGWRIHIVAIVIALFKIKKLSPASAGVRRFGQCPHHLLRLQRKSIFHPSTMKCDGR